MQDSKKGRNGGSGPSACETYNRMLDTIAKQEKQRENDSKNKKKNSKGKTKR